MRKSKIRGLIVGTAFGSLAFVGVASAAFFIQSSTTVATHSASISAPTVTTTVVGDLWPGYLNDVDMTITNPNPVALHPTVSQATLGAPTFTGDPSELAFATPAVQAAVLTTLGHTEIPAGGTVTLHFADLIGLKSTAEAQNASVSVTVSGIGFKAVPGTETP